MRKIRNFQIFSIIFTCILGTLLHFTYQLSGENHIVAVFSAINESVWEHLKILYFPMLITTIIGCFYFGKKVNNFLCSKMMGIICAMMFMVIFFYTYTGILGENVPIVDIASFFIATILGELIAYVLMINKFQCSNKVSIIVLALIFIYFIVFTYNTPNLGIFKDPLTGKYGMGN